MSKSEVADVYQELLAVVQKYAEAVARREINNLGAVPRTASRNVAERLAEFLAQHRGEHDLTGLAREFGLSRALVASAARRLVRSGRALYAKRRTAVRAKPSESEFTPAELQRMAAYADFVREHIGERIADLKPSLEEDPKGLFGHAWIGLCGPGGYQYDTESGCLVPFGTLQRDDADDDAEVAP